ncbi:hypothetical protein Q1W70_23240 [Pseudomonas kielensis]|uniref:HNH endonuclease n=1 Tax=Pseudomonas TaxID=286 RepID=UPI001411BB09|nr:MULTISPECIES: hypothetical protein [Pseudomonas]NBB33345.1 hypothetical protein [Pseudomonas sp. BC115LW]WKL52328.1 hypothetical protein Q1W70_23240 [Pseudomonas kielensis]
MSNEKSANATEPKLSAAEKRKAQRIARLALVRELISAAKNKEKDVWARLGDTDNAVSKNLKAILRDHLKARQEPRCCYCKRWLINNAHASPIEHILPRDDYPQFALHTRNLAIACNDCNAMKANDDWGKSTGPHERYPLPAAMSFFHPFYHRYDDHIRFVRMETNRQELVTYQGLTPQGRQLCTALLSKVVGKQNLKRNCPQLANWLRPLDELDVDRQSPTRPALQAFLAAVEVTVAQRLNDADRASALWVIPQEPIKKKQTAGTKRHPTGTHT